MLDVQDTGCCAVNEIVHLSDHKTPKDAMINVCSQILTNYNEWDIREVRNDIQNLEEELERGEIDKEHFEREMRYFTEDLDYLTRGGSVPGLITFTGVVEHTDKSKSLKGFKYGPNFAAFIRKHKLGDLVESNAGVNRVNHPTHVVKHWCWTPDPKRLEAWYKRNKGKKTKRGG